MQCSGDKTYNLLLRPFFMFPAFCRAFIRPHLNTLVFLLCALLLSAAPRHARAQAVTVNPVADAYVQDGAAGNTNYHTGTYLFVKKNATVGSNRLAYLKFDVSALPAVPGSVRLRVYGKHAQGPYSGTDSVSGVTDSTWTETGLTFNNRPAAGAVLAHAAVGSVNQYVEWDVTGFVAAQKAAGATLVSLCITMDGLPTDKLNDNFFSRETPKSKPQLVALPVGNLTMQNMDGLPALGRMVFSRIGTLAAPPPNAVHDRAVLRLANVGSGPISVTGVPLTGAWTLLNPPAFPVSIAAGGTLDLTVLFTAEQTGMNSGALSVQTSNAAQGPLSVALAGYAFPTRTAEPTLAQILSLFGYSTNPGFLDKLSKTQGGSTARAGDETVSAYWVQADPAQPVSVRQMAAFHTYDPASGRKSTLFWHRETDKASIQASEAAGTQSTLMQFLFAHDASDAQTLLPRTDGAAAGTASGPAQGVFNPGGAAFGLTVDYFAGNAGLEVGSAGESSDPDLTAHAGDLANGGAEPCGHHVRFWPVVGADGQIVPFAYVCGVDYNANNYDFQDAVYLVSNVKPEAEDFAAYVNPFIGTARGIAVTGGLSSGATYPGAQVPFGMVALSPDTPPTPTTPPAAPALYNAGGYDYGAATIQGFSHTHLSGPGGQAYGDIPFLPTTGAVTTSNSYNYASAFSHSTETASPGAYAVHLDTYNVNAELTASTHVGWHRYSFPAGTQANVLMNVSGSLRGAANAAFQVVNNNTVEGFVSSYAYQQIASINNTTKPYTVYFSAQFSRPFAACGTWNGGTLSPGSTSAAGANAGGWVTFDAANSASVVAKVGLSFVSVQGARNNLSAEAPDVGGAPNFQFDAAKQAAQARWSTILHRVDTAGGTRDQRAVFYTALYHSLLLPNVWSDADGTYTGFDKLTHVTSGAAEYANFSLWDTYRTEHPLLALVAPAQNHDMLASLMDIHAQAGWLPRWAFANIEANSMLGDPALPVLADGWAKGQLGALDPEAVYQAMRHNATQTPPAGSEFEGRLGLSTYMASGYVPYVPKKTGVPIKLQAGATITLEYALSDGALSLMAAGLGHAADAQALAARAHGPRTLWDSATGYTHPRMTDGTFLSPFYPISGTGFKEGTAAQYTWMTPQDVGGLASEMGGMGPAAARLDQFLDFPGLQMDAPGVLQNEWGQNAYYNPFNEVTLHTPYLYDYWGQPWKTQATVRTAETLYSNTTHGIPGNDDLGAMSAWYVLSALGIYPTMPGTGVYALTSPLFPHAAVSLDPAYYTMPQLTIDAPGANAANQYVQSLTLNGAAYGQDWLRHSDIQAGAHLVYTLGAYPNTSWAADPTLAPPAVCP